MIKINSREELLGLGNVWFDWGDEVRIGGYGIFHLEDEKYPKYFKYNSPIGNECGHYCETTKKKYIETLKGEIEATKKFAEREIDRINKLLAEELEG